MGSLLECQIWGKMGRGKDTGDGGDAVGKTCCRKSVYGQLKGLTLLAAVEKLISKLYQK
jgi:hypothetical protein